MVFYCQDCLEEGHHRHRHTQIFKVFEDYEKQWSTLKENTDRLLHKSTSLYTPLAPLIKYIEAHLPTNKKESSLTAKMEKLMALSKEIGAALNQIEQHVMRKEVRELFAMRDQVTGFTNRLANFNSLVEISEDYN